MGYKHARSGCLGEYGAMIKVHWMQSLYRHAGALPLLEDSVFYRRWTAEVGEERRVDIQTAILRVAQNARRHKQTKGHGDDKVNRDGRCPFCEGVGDMGVELELFGGYTLDGNYRRSVDTPREESQAHCYLRSAFLSLGRCASPVGAAHRLNV
jgi:hypothetical protein